MMPVRATALAIAALLAALIAGCGGDDSTATETSTVELPAGELTKLELATQADALCTDANERIAAAADPPEFGDDGPQPEEVEASAAFWSASATENEVLVDQLSQLQPEKAQAREWDEFVALMQTGTVDFATGLLEPAESGDPDGFYAAALDSQKDLQDLASTAKGLGIEICGSSDVPSS